MGVEKTSRSSQKYTNFVVMHTIEQLKANYNSHIPNVFHMKITANEIGLEIIPCMEQKHSGIFLGLSFQRK